MGSPSGNSANQFSCCSETHNISYCYCTHQDSKEALLPGLMELVLYEYMKNIMVPVRQQVPVSGYLLLSQLRMIVGAVIRF